MAESGTVPNPHQLAERYSRLCKPSELEVRDTAAHGLVEATVTLAAAKRRAAILVGSVGLCLLGILILTLAWLL